MGYLIGLVLFVLSLLMATLVDFSDLTIRNMIVYFIDAQSLGFVIIPAFGFTVAAFSMKGIAAAFRGAFGPPGALKTDEQELAKGTLVLFGNLSVFIGVVGFLIGQILLLQNLTDPSFIGPATAVALITLFYGLLIKVLCYAAERKLDSQS